MTQNCIRIEDLLRISPNMQVVVTVSDLKEFALSVVNEMKDSVGSGKEDDTLYSPTEFAEKHNVNKSTLWRWRKAGILTQTKIGGKVYYRESNLKQEEE